MIVRREFITGARNASLDAAESISDFAATKSQLLIRSPRQLERAASAELQVPASWRFSS
jgi:hypothetical protein